MIASKEIHRKRRFLADQSGAAMVEFAVVCALFFFIFFAMIDFGRLMYTFVHAEKAAQIAARIATVRGPACGNMPIGLRNEPISGVGVQAGTSCDAGTNFCTPRSYSCGSITRTAADFPNGTLWSHSPAIDPTNATVIEIWDAIDDLMPVGATVSSLNFRYDFDEALGFVGGPYTPVVTVEFDLEDFQFVSPIAGLASLAAGGAGGATTGTIRYPSFSVSLPAEDLVNGPT